MQTVPQVLRVILPFVYCTVISGLFLQIFSTFSASLGGAVFIYCKCVFRQLPFLVLGLLLLKGFVCRCWGTGLMELHWAWNMDPVLTTNTLWTHSYFKLKWLMTYGKLVKNLNYWPFRNVFLILLAKEPFLVRNCICISESTLRVGQ